MVMEYCKGGTLLDYIAERKKCIKEEIIVGIAKQLASVLGYLKRNCVVHRDIKLENVMLTGRKLEGSDETPEIKLIDFGLSGIMLPSQSAVEPYGTLEYVAP